MSSPNPPQECSRQPEPVKGACGVTRDRLRRPVTEPVCRRFGGYRVRGRGLGQDRARPDCRKQAGRWRRGPGRHAIVSREPLGAGDEQSSTAPDPHGQRALTSPRPRTDLNGSGWRYRNLRIRRRGFGRSARRSAHPRSFFTPSPHDLHPISTIAAIAEQGIPRLAMTGSPGRGVSDSCRS